MVKRKIHGKGRLNPIVKNMYDSLKAMYPSSTLKTVAHDILKITGHKITGSARKKTSAYDIAKYVITAIGVTLAIALAIFIISQNKEDYSGLEQPIRISHQPYEVDQSVGAIARRQGHEPLHIIKPTENKPSSIPYPKLSNEEIYKKYEENVAKIREASQAQKEKQYKQFGYGYDDKPTYRPILDAGYRKHFILKKVKGKNLYTLIPFTN
jgi:hypothetical protein